MPGAGLRRRHVRVRDEVDVGPGDAAGVAGEDDGAVHLRQLRKSLRAERGVEQEPAGADVEDLGSVAHHEQRAHVRLQDPVEAVTQRLPRGDGRQGIEQRDAAPGGHGRIVVCRGCRSFVCSSTKDRPAERPPGSRTAMGHGGATPEQARSFVCCSTKDPPAEQPPGSRTAMGHGGATPEQARSFVCCSTKDPPAEQPPGSRTAMGHGGATPEQARSFVRCSTKDPPAEPPPGSRPATGHGGATPEQARSFVCRSTNDRPAERPPGSRPATGHGGAAPEEARSCRHRPCDKAGEADRVGN